MGKVNLGVDSKVKPLIEINESDMGRGVVVTPESLSSGALKAVAEPH